MDHLPFISLSQGFLSCLLGSERVKVGGKSKLRFLSCLLGSELSPIAS